MPTFKTVEYTAQSAAASNGAQMADGNRIGSTVLHARVRYTLVSTETVADIIQLVTLGPGATVIPALSSVYSADPGTTLTGTVGITGDDDAYSSALTLSAGGLQRFTPTTYPDEFLVPTVVNFVVASAGTLTAGVVLEFDIAYTTRH